MPLSNAFPNSEFEEKNTSITVTVRITHIHNGKPRELDCCACKFGMLALDFLPIVNITHS